MPDVPNAPLGRADVRRAVRGVLGQEGLLPGQAEAIVSITAGHDTLALLPTGGGKSASRRAFLLGYFGEPFEPPCDNCDRCLAAEGEAPVTIASDEERRYVADAPGFEVGARLRHAIFGEGTVTSVESDRATVAFDEVRYRVIDLGAPSERGLLTEA